MKNTPAGINAKSYDEYATTYTKPWNIYLMKRIQDEIKSLKHPVKNMLDVGTGTAHTLIDLAQSKNLQQCKLIGIDFFEDMVNEARKNIIKKGLENRIEIIHGDVHEMHIPDNSIDLVFGRSVIHHWENPIKAYKEIYRILTPNGVCIIHEPSREPSIEALENFNKLRSDFGIGEMSLTEKFTASEVKAQVILAGLENQAAIYEGKNVLSLGFELKINKNAYSI